MNLEPQQEQEPGPQVNAAVNFSLQDQEDNEEITEDGHAQQR